MGIQQNFLDSQDKINNFLNFLSAKELMDKTKEDYIGYLKHFLSGLDGELTLDYCLRFLKERKNNNVVRAFLSNYLESINRTDIRIPKITGNQNKRTKEFRWITREDVNKIANEFSNTDDPIRNRLMLAITFQGGLRVSELMSLNYNSFNWTDWNKDRENSIEVKIIGKRNKTRFIRLTSDIACLIEDYLTKMFSVLSIEDVNKKEISLFCNSGCGCSIRRWREILSNSSFKAIKKKVNPHCLRHSLAMYVKSQGWDLDKIRKYLGHGSLQTTLIYAETTDKELEESFKKDFS